MRAKRRSVLKSSIRKELNLDTSVLHCLVIIKYYENFSGIFDNLPGVQFHIYSDSNLNDSEIEDLFQVCDFAFITNEDYLNTSFRYGLKTFTYNTDKQNDYKITLSVNENPIDIIKDYITDYQTIVKKNDEVVIVLSYADTKRKLDLLEECVRENKKRGYDVIISSSISVPDYISDLSDYLIVDKENPIITGEDFDKIGGIIFFWMDYPGYKHTYPVNYNHSYAVLKLMRNAISIAKSNNYSISHMINYDFVIYDNLFEEHSKQLLDNDVYCYECNHDNGIDYNDNYIRTTLFSIKTDIFDRCFGHIKTKDDFCRERSSILEELMYVIFSENVKILRVNSEKMYYGNIIDQIGTADFNISKLYDKDGDIILLNTYLYLSKDNSGNPYIFFLTHDKVSLNIQLNDGYNINTILGKVYVFRLENKNLEQGFKVTIPEYEYEKIFDLNTRFATCEVDENIIINL